MKPETNMSTDIFSPCINMNDKHLALIKAVNDAKTEHEHQQANAYLRGWREGVKDSGGRQYDWTLADLHHEGEDANRPMCLGVFSDWKEPDPTPIPSPYCPHCGASAGRHYSNCPISKDD